MTMRVRRAEPDDLEQVVEYNCKLAQESEGKALEPALITPGVAAVLNDARKGTYFLAEEHGKVVGQMSITLEWSDWRNGWFWWIQSVYVPADSRRKGIFRAMYDHVRDCAQRDPEVIGIRLYVEGDNEIAHKTYIGIGMKWTSYRVMERYPL